MGEALIVWLVEWSFWFQELGEAVGERLSCLLDAASKSLCW